jgi:hypothetical protein
MQSSNAQDSEEPQFRNLREAVWACDELGHIAKLVALRLVEHWPQIWPSIAFIGQRCKLSERAVRYALRELEATGMIETEGRHRKSSRYWFCSSTGARVIIPKLGRGKPAGGGGGDETPPTGDPDDFAEEEPPSHTGNVTSIRHGVPRSTGHSVPPTRHRVPPSEGHSVPPKQITSSKQIMKGGNARAARSLGRKRPAPPPVFTSFEGWTLSPELRDELIALGVNGARIAARIRALRNRPGVLGDGVSSLDEYIREQAELRWVDWDKADAAVSSGGNGARSSFAGGGGTSGGGAGSGAPARVPGFPSWVHPEHAEFAKKNGLQLKPAALAFDKASYHKPHTLNPVDVRVPFRKFLEAMALKKAKAA